MALRVLIAALLAPALAAPVAPVPGPVWASGLAVESGERLRVELVGGALLEGYFLRTDGAVLVLSTENQALEVSAPLITAVWRGQDPVPPEQFRAELEAWALAAQPIEKWHPAPLLVGAASVVWPGAGHAILGDWHSFAGYSVVECVLLGVAAYQVFYQESYGPLVPIAALDLMFRGTATADAVRTAKRQRATLVIAPTNEGFQVLWVFTGPSFD